MKENEEWVDRRKDNRKRKRKEEVVREENRREGETKIQDGG